MTADGIGAALVARRFAAADFVEPNSGLEAFVTFLAACLMAVADFFFDAAAVFGRAFAGLVTVFFARAARPVRVFARDAMSTSVYVRTSAS